MWASTFFSQPIVKNKFCFPLIAYPSLSNVIYIFLETQLNLTFRFSIATLMRVETKRLEYFAQRNTAVTTRQTEVKMKPVLHSLVVLLIATIGCENSQTTSILSGLEATNSQLKRQLDDESQKTAQMEQRVVSLEAEWKRFEQNFDSEKRQELAKNIAETDQMLVQVAKSVESSSNVLTKLKGLEAEILKLRDICAKHASESADLDQFGQVKDAIFNVDKQLKDSITRVEKNASSLKSSINWLESSVRSLESSVRSVSSDVSSIRMKVR
jgi:septal ring factor EnvC (AmiA/AmiB activator)